MRLPIPFLDILADIIMLYTLVIYIYVYRICIPIVFPLNTHLPPQHVQAKAADESVAEDGWGFLERQQGGEDVKVSSYNEEHIYICIYVLYML